MKSCEACGGVPALRLRHGLTIWTEPKTGTQRRRKITCFHRFPPITYSTPNPLQIYWNPLLRVDFGVNLPVPPLETPRFPFELSAGAFLTWSRASPWSQATVFLIPESGFN